MEFEIIFYKDNEGNNPIEEFVLELGKNNKVLAAKNTCKRTGNGKKKTQRNKNKGGKLIWHGKKMI